ncbi:MAG: diacylglycerol kinase family lipid kinase [Planctomycetes bacterium]|nr:diacylglycerol kinase family lipid kinase [Planctomycetota bacterium]
MRNAECGMGEDGRSGENPALRAQSASDGSSSDQRSAISGQLSAVSGQQEQNPPRDLRRFLLVANPMAGKGRGKRLAEHVDQRLSAAGVASEIKWTTASDDAERIARDALDNAGANERICLVPCGGDGTVQEVVNAILSLRESGAVLGLAPGGRCNDFASTFGITPDAEQIADTLLAGRTRRVDVGRINDRYYCTIAATGFDAAVSRYVNDTKLPLVGTMAYIIGTLRVLLTFKPVAVRLKFDDTLIEEELFLVATANTPSYGGKMRIAPMADVADGLLDVCIVSKMSRLSGLNLLRAVLQGRHTELPGVRFVRTAAIEIETADRREVWADGEFITDTPVRIEAVPQALEVVTPHRAEAL